MILEKATHETNQSYEAFLIDNLNIIDKFREFRNFLMGLQKEFPDIKDLIEKTNLFLIILNRMQQNGLDTNKIRMNGINEASKSVGLEPLFNFC